MPTSAEPGTRRPVELSRNPSLVRLFARATVTSRLPSGSRAGSLPATELVRRGVQAQPDHLADYSRVCGLDLSGRLPSTYLHVLTFPLQVALMADREFPLPLPGLVHLRNTNVLHRPVLLGERLDLAVHAESLRRHPRGALVDLVARAEVAREEHDGDGDGDARPDLVWTGRSTYLCTGASAPTEDESADHPGAKRPDQDLPQPLPEPRTGSWRVPADLGRRYAAVSGDVNPIHLSALAAKGFGFPTTIAHGMWTYARTLGWLGSKVAAAHTATVEFHRPVLLPSSVDLYAAAGSSTTSNAIAWTVELRPGGSRAGATGRDGDPMRHLRATVRPL